MIALRFKWNKLRQCFKLREDFKGKYYNSCIQYFNLDFLYKQNVLALNETKHRIIFISSLPILWSYYSLLLLIQLFNRINN